MIYLDIKIGSQGLGKQFYPTKLISSVDLILTCTRDIDKQIARNEVTINRTRLGIDCRQDYRVGTESYIPRPGVRSKQKDIDLSCGGLPTRR